MCVIQHILFFSFTHHSYTTFATGKFPLGMQNMKINETPIDMPDIDDKVQEMVDFEKDLYQSTRDLKKLNKKKRKKALLSNNVDVQPPAAKKMKLSKVDSDAKLKKKKSVDSWVETDLTPEEISINGNSSCAETINGSTTDHGMENVINSTTGKSNCLNTPRPIPFPPFNNPLTKITTIFGFGFRTIYRYGRGLGSATAGGRRGILHFEEQYKAAYQRSQREIVQCGGQSAERSPYADCWQKTETKVHADIHTECTAHTIDAYECRKESENYATVEP